MSTSLYDLGVPALERMLGQFDLILAKAEAHAAARKIDPAVLLGARLFPDMFPLTRQVLIACDFARGGCQRLAGVAPDKWADDEASFPELRERVARTRAVLAGLSREQFEGAAERVVEIRLKGEPAQMAGLAYLNRMVLPNFYFHFTTAYDILRHNGVELGKSDFLGPLP